MYSTMNRAQGNRGRLWVINSPVNNVIKTEFRLPEQ